MEHLNVRLLLRNPAKNVRWVSYTFLQKPRSFKRFSTLEKKCGSGGGGEAPHKHFDISWDHSQKTSISALWFFRANGSGASLAWKDKNNEERKVGSFVKVYLCNLSQKYCGLTCHAKRIFMDPCALHTLRNAQPGPAMTRNGPLCITYTMLCTTRSSHDLKWTIVHNICYNVHNPIPAMSKVDPCA